MWAYTFIVFQNGIDLTSVAHVVSIACALRTQGSLTNAALRIIHVTSISRLITVPNTVLTNIRRVWVFVHSTRS